MRFISQYPNNMEVLLYTVLTLCVLGILAALILYFVAQKFKVEEDPRIDEVEKMLPGANCGGCGFAGCRGLADALVKRTDISSLFCPVGGAEVMKTVAAYLARLLRRRSPRWLPSAAAAVARNVPDQCVRRCYVLRGGCFALWRRNGVYVRLPGIRGLCDGL